MANLMGFFKKNALFTILILLIITGLFGYRIKDVVIDPSSEGFMISNDPEKIFYEKTVETFGSDNMVVVFVEDENLFTHEKLSAVLDVIDELNKKDFVEKVNSLFNQKNIKSTPDGLITENFIDPGNIPTSADSLLVIKKDAIRNPLVTKNLISDNGKVLAINVQILKKPDVDNYDTIVTEEIEKVLSKLDGKVQTYFQIGAPYFKHSLVEYIINDQMTLVPIAVFFLFVVLVLSLRSLNAALMPLATSGISVIWTFGFMAYMGIPVNIITVIVPSLLIVIGATEDIHMLSEYLEGLEHNNDRNMAIDYMASKVGLAVLLTAFTTVAGFSSIILNDITILKQFGVVTTFALASNFIITVSFIPSFLRFFGRTEHAKHHNSDDNFFTRIIDKIIKLIYWNKFIVLSVLLTFAVVMGAGIFQIKVNNDTLSYFKASSEIRQRADILTHELSGVQSFYVTVDAKKKNAFKSPEILKKIFAFEEFIRSTGDFDKVTGIPDFIALVNREMRDGNQEFYKVPDSKGLVSQYLLMFHRKDLERYVTGKYDSANIIVKHSISSSHKLNLAVEKLREYVKNNFDDSLDIKFTGENILVNRAADTIAKGQVASLTLILLVIFVIMSLLFLNVKAGLLSMVPNVFPIAIVLGMMGYFDIDLNIGTAMIAAISIGIAVDDTIHLMVRYNTEMKKLNNQDDAIISSLRSEGRPVLSTTTALAIGFGLLVLSNFKPVINFGWLSAIVMMVAVVADLIITPILLSTTRLITIWDMLGLKLKENVFHSPVFKGMRRWHVKKLILSTKIIERKQGELIIEQGKKEQTAYLIIDGEVSVNVSREDGSSFHVKDMFSGEIIGEIALFGELERTANVAAKTDCTVLCFDWDALERIRKYLPMISARFFLNLSSILGERLAYTTKELSRSEK